MAQDWDIKPRGTACTACNAAFADKQSYHSALTFGEQGYARADYCATCWTGTEVAAKAYSAWQGVFRMPPPEPEEPLRRENAEALVRRLIAEEPEARSTVIFILMVMLERTRVVVERDVQTRQDGGLIRIYEHKKSGETFVVVDPGLRFEQLEEVEREVMELLGVDPTRGKGKQAAAGRPAPAEGAAAAGGAAVPDGAVPSAGTEPAASPVVTEGDAVAAASSPALAETPEPA